MRSPTLEAEARRARRLKARVKRIFRGFVIFLGAFAISGIIYQAVAEHADRRHFPPPGKSIDVGGFSLNIHCTGAGSPTVILESGLGVPGAGWNLVQPEVAKFAQVCSYDRAGYGWSGAGPFPRTSREIAHELHTLLERAGLSPPYIFVGHSFGGFNVRVFNSLFPGEVAGMALVDSSHEDQDSKITPAMRELNAKDLRRLRRMKPVMPLLIDLGIARAAAAVEPGSGEIPPDLKEEITYLQLQSKFVAAILSEESSFDESANEVRASGNLGDMPLIVLTAGASLRVPGISKAELDAFHEIWVKELQASLTRLSTRGRQIILDNAHHMIPFEQPQAVVAAIREVTEAAQRK